MAVRTHPKPAFVPVETSRKGIASSERRVAIAVGALYIVATVAGLLATAALGSLLDGPGVLIHLDAHETRVLAAVFFELVLAVAVAGIAFMIYPILKQDADTPGKQGLALWYVGTRVTEGTLGLVGILGLLSLFALSQEVARAGASQPVRSRRGPCAEDGIRLLGGAWANGILRGRSDAVLPALRVETHSPVVVHLGSHRSSPDARGGLLARGQRGSQLDLFDHHVRPTGPAGDGPCRVADTQRIQLACDPLRRRSRPKVPGSAASLATPDFVRRKLVPRPFGSGPRPHRSS